MLESMQAFYRRLSVRNRLILAIFTASLSVVFVVAIVLVFFSARTMQQQAEADLRTTIDVLNQDFVKILLLDSQDVAADTVSKLQAFPDVLAAFLYDEAGQFRFGYQKQGQEPVAVPAYQETDIRYHDQYLEVFTTLYYQQRKFGALYVRLSLAGFKQRVHAYFQLLLIAVPVLVLLALLVAIRFQRSFSEPVQKLASAFDEVTDSDRYRLRLETSEQNEIGRLFAGFNRMLARIQLANDDLQQARERLHVTLESIGDGVVAIDAKGNVVYLNQSAEKVLRWSGSEANGRPVQDVVRIIKEGGQQQEVNLCQIALREAREVPEQASLLLINREGELVPVALSVSPMWASDGTVIGAVMVIRDVTESRRLARELSYQATHDSLTDLLNRSEFERILGQEIESGSSREERYVLLYLDLDQFKVVNDTCGHLAGDQLLKQLASVLRGELRASDVLARLGGDEFGVLLMGCDEIAAGRIAESLRRAVTEFRFVWEKHTFNVGVSIGLVAIDEYGHSVADLLSAADVACYAAKDSGRNRIQVFQPDDVETQRRYGEVQWVSRIMRALDENRFRLYRQRIEPVEPGAERGEHFEVLIRMLDEQEQLVIPGSFFSAAERFGVSPSIDRWVLRNTLSYLGSGSFDLATLHLCGINISGHTLADEHFLDFVESQLNHSQVPAEKICFEITETAAISNLVTAKRFIARLKERGCRFALDDFGSGLSSFGYLKSLDVDYLKIDGMFVRDMAEDPIDRSMVKSINEVGHVMGMKTIAEFVENDSIRDQLRVIGVDYAQGYGIHRPEPMSLPQQADVPDPA